MSSFPHLLILLLHLSLQPCSGRHLRFMDSSSLPYHSHKADQVEPSKHSLERGQSLNLGPVNKGNVHDVQGDVTAKRVTGPETTPLGIKSRRVMATGVTKIQSRDTDPSHVSHEKLEEQFEFNIDYEPPRLHPPSHN